MSKNKTIGVLTSGGDAPGMNAAIRAIVRTAINSGMKVKGIQRGFAGLLDNEIIDMNTRSVSEIMRRGGTMLFTARCEAFKTAEGQQKGAEILRENGIDGLIVIGGDGSFQGAQKLSALGINTIAIPGTIDLDIACTDYTIGFDTAVNTAMAAIDKIKDTSMSHERCSIVEVMGRNAGYIALWCEIANGADGILIPEKEDFDEEELINTILSNRKKGKTHHVVIRRYRSIQSSGPPDRDSHRHRNPCHHFRPYSARRRSDGQRQSLCIHHGRICRRFTAQRCHQPGHCLSKRKIH